MENAIDVVGVGSRGAGGLTGPARETLDRATVLVGSERQLGYFREHPAKKIVSRDFFAGIREIATRADAGERVVVLASGDPLFFGIGRLLLEHFPADRLRFYPHLNSIQLACSRLKISWQDIRIISVHGRGLEEIGEALQEGVEKIAVLTDGKNDPRAIARLYRSLSPPGAYHFWICEDLEADGEKISGYAPGDIEKLAGAGGPGFAALTVVVLVRGENVLPLESLPLFGIPDRAFFGFPDRPNQITKREIRVAILGELCLQPDGVIWDIGAGTGSVAVEIARLCPAARVYAIERTAAGVTLIAKNRERFGVTNLYPVHAFAPEGLSELPAPDRVFIGGSGGRLGEILSVCAARSRAGGRILLAMATLEHLRECGDWFASHRWPYHLVSLHIDRSVAVGEFTRWSPLNPVTLAIAPVP